MRNAVSLLLATAVLALAPAAVARTSRPPVVVELFTAQGCEGCPEANKLIGGLAQRRDVLPLTFSVDYWDYLGWRDTLAMPQFTERQRAYVRRLKVGDLYTPEVVVGGQAEAPAVDPSRIDGMVRKAGRVRSSGAPRLTLNRRGTRVRVSAGAAGRSADVWMVRFDPAVTTVRVRGDDRKTRTVTVQNAARELVKLGVWRGRGRSYALPAPSAPGLATAVLVQERDGGSILSAGRS